MKVVLTEQDVTAIVIQSLKDAGVLEKDTAYTAKHESYSNDFLTIKKVEPKTDTDEGTE